MEREMESHRYSGYKEECTACKSKDYKIKSLESEVEVYKNSVKKRRNASHVWTDGDDVRYEK